ncbi:MAG: FAD synthetase family protein [Treponema sp.]|jgi:riboflavin kinase/FMN adenylyltransferase|nr:FAD synthetase family protein [Treponema sp.]
MLALEWSEFAASGLAGTEFAGEGLAMTVGVFDGIHRGHQVLLERVLSSGLTPAAVCFRRSPKFILRPETDEGDIMGAEQKLRLLGQMGIALTVMIDFSRKFGKLSGREFIDLLADRGNLRFLVIGGNFRCGYRHSTDAALIRKMCLSKGIPTEVAAPLAVGGNQISSSRIRVAIASGSLAEASEFLGRRVEIDFAGLAAVSGPGGVYFDLASQNRLMPPPGSYPALLFDNSPTAREVEISIDKKGVFIPLDGPGPDTVRRVEFLGGSQ